MFSKLLFRWSLLLCLLVPLLSCKNANNREEILLHPALLAIDSTNDRAIVVDQNDNTLSIVTTSDDQVIDDEPILDSADTQVLPALPQAVLAINMGSSVTRIFVSGNASDLVVFDFDGTTLSQTAFSPITVGSASSDFIGGLTYDATNGRIFASNATDGKVYVFDVDDGTAIANSPITVSGKPRGLAFDATLNRVAVSNADSTSVAFINTSDLTAAVTSLSVGVTTHDVALASNANGSVLFFVSENANTAGAYLVNTSDVSTSTLLGNLLEPVGPNDALPSPNILTGDLVRIKAASLSTDILKAFITQSSGDIAILEVPADLSTMVPAITTVGAASAEGLDILLDDNSDASKVYYASPGTGNITIINASTNIYLDQII